MRFDLPEDKIFVHEARFALEWGDMDALGHVNNAAYFRYMENARVGWMYAIGARPDRGNANTELSRAESNAVSCPCTYGLEADNAMKCGM